MFAAIVTGDPTKTTFNAIALDILARHGGKTDWEDRPGSIRSLVDPKRLEAVMANAGFTDVVVSSIPTVQRLESAAAATTMIREGFAFYKSNDRSSDTAATGRRLERIGSGARTL
jgi:hypothetical protein